MDKLHIFISHSSKDAGFCRPYVGGLEKAGAVVWYDEHDLNALPLRGEITDALCSHNIFVPILSKAAFSSDWVHDECEWAYNLLKREAVRIILPVIAAPIEDDDFNRLLFLEPFPRVGDGGHKPLPVNDAVKRTLQLVKRTFHKSNIVGQATPATAPQVAQVDDIYCDVEEHPSPIYSSLWFFVARKRDEQRTILAHAAYLGLNVTEETLNAI